MDDEPLAIGDPVWESIDDKIRRIAREEAEKVLAEQQQRLMPTVMNGCPRACPTNTVCLRPDCALRLEER